MGDLIILEESNVIRIIRSVEYIKIFLKDEVVVDSSQKQRAAVIRVLRDLSCLDIIKQSSIFNDIIERCQLNLLNLQQNEKS